MIAAVLLSSALAAATVDAGPRPVEVPDVQDAGASDEGSDAGVAAVVPAGFSVKAHLEPDPVVFGGVVELVVTITRPPRRNLDVPKDVYADTEPDEKLPRTGDVRREAHELPAPPSTDDAGVAGRDDKVQEVLRFPFLALDLKDLKTPAFVIKSEDAVLEVPSLPVRVQVEPINDNVDGGVPDGAVVIDAAASSLIYKVRDDRPFIALAVLAVIALLAFITRRLLQRSRAKRAAIVPPPPPPRPAWEVAIERLDALMPLLQRGEVTVFVEKLMDEVLRDYLASRFALSTGTRTTKEIVIDLLGTATTNLDVPLVEEVGKDADLVKFARAHLAAQQAHAMAGRVRALILATADRAAGPTTTTTAAQTPTKETP